MPSTSSNVPETFKCQLLKLKHNFSFYPFFDLNLLVNVKLISFCVYFYKLFSIALALWPKSKDKADIEIFFSYCCFTAKNRIIDFIQKSSFPMNTPE